MTDDTHGTEPPHDPEAEANHEQDPAAAPEGEAWRGGVDDDFNDPAAVEMTSASEPEGEVPLEEENTQSIEASPQKRGIMLPLIVIVGGLVLLGVLGYWQFGDSLRGEAPPPLGSVAASKPPAPVKPAPIVAAAPAQTASLPTEGVSPKTDMIPPSPAPVAAAPVALVPPPAPLAPAAAAPPAVNMPMPAPTPTAVVTVSPTSSPNGPSFALPQAAPAVPGVSIKASGDVDTRMNAISTHIEQLQKTLDATAQQLSQINTRLNDLAQKPSSVDERIAGLEQKIMQMQGENNAPVAMAPVVKAPKSAVHVAAPRPSAPHVAKTKKPAPVVHHETISWVLRAASPGEAWIATDNDTPDLKAVHVGDEVPGVGHVTAIQEENGKWVVYGSQGAIH